MFNFKKSSVEHYRQFTLSANEINKINEDALQELFNPAKKYQEYAKALLELLNLQYVEKNKLINYRNQLFNQFLTFLQESAAPDLIKQLNAIKNQLLSNPNDLASLSSLEYIITREKEGLTKRLLMIISSVLTFDNTQQDFHRILKAHNAFNQHLEDDLHSFNGFHLAYAYYRASALITLRNSLDNLDELEKQKIVHLEACFKLFLGLLRATTSSFKIFEFEEKWDYVAWLSGNEEQSRVEFLTAIKNLYQTNQSAEPLQNGLINILTALLEMDIQRCNEDLKKAFLELDAQNVTKFEREFLSYPIFIQDNNLEEEYVIQKSEGKLDRVIAFERHLKKQYPNLTQVEFAIIKNTLRESSKMLAVEIKKVLKNKHNEENFQCGDRKVSLKFENGRLSEIVNYTYLDGIKGAEDDENGQTITTSVVKITNKCKVINHHKFDELLAAKKIDLSVGGQGVVTQHTFCYEAVDPKYTLSLPTFIRPQLAIYAHPMRQAWDYFTKNAVTLGFSVAFGGLIGGLPGLLLGFIVPIGLRVMSDKLIPAYLNFMAAWNNKPPQQKIVEITETLVPSTYKQLSQQLQVSSLQYLLDVFNQSSKTDSTFKLVISYDDIIKKLIFKIGQLTATGKAIEQLKDFYKQCHDPKTFIAAMTILSKELPEHKSLFMEFNESIQTSKSTTVKSEDTHTKEEKIKIIETNDINSLYQSRRVVK